MPPRTDTEPTAAAPLSHEISAMASVSSSARLALGTAVAGARHPEPSTPIVLIVAVSALAHVMVAIALGAIGPVRLLALDEPTFVDFDIAEPAALPPPPVVEPPPPPLAAPPPALRPRATPQAATPQAEPEPVTPEPPPAEPTAAPPSLDDVFGEEPAPAAPVMVAEGTSGGPAMDPGAAGGRSGGRAGGTGEGVGPGGGGGHSPSGPSDADIQRARRAYVRSLQGILSGRVRYPRALERAGVGGRVELCIRIGSDGRVLGSRVCGSAGQGQLDDAALDAAAGLGRVPAPPAIASWSSTDEIHAGVVFAVR
jgi:protein TonB